ncbi:MAG: FKBP-type peptidyl-prolyl cis-trans isomerase [Bacteroidales bacterium]|jgi:FKBP-type peptidyl-prolyl cis-trans isomerase|nr:FKBP-type peptidyl-prolyl cis-trans isomerase [Bacteroidales bacterium]
MRYRRFIIPAFLLIVIAVCLTIWLSRRHYNVQTPDEPSTNRQHQHAEALIRANQVLIEKDFQEIKAFASQNGWKMQTTQSGLWYEIYHHGTGEQAATGKLAEIAYTLSLPDSIHTVCYSSAQLGNKTFLIGQGGVETGLEEGILLMHTGDKARFVLPPHLAHGLTGDGDCIPRRAIIVYEVELLKLN